MKRRTGGRRGKDLSVTEESAQWGDGERLMREGTSEDGWFLIMVLTLI